MEIAIFIQYASMQLRYGKIFLGVFWRHVRKRIFFLISTYTSETEGSFWGEISFEG